MSDDLDSLLNEALDVMDAQDRQHEEEVKAREHAAAQLLAEQQHAFGSTTGDPSGGEAALMSAMSSILEVLRKGPEALESAPEEEMTRIQTMLTSALETIKPGASPEELSSIEKCAQMLQKAGEASSATEGTDAAPLTAEELESVQQMMNSLGKEMSALTSETGMAPAAPAAPASPSSSQAVPPPAGDAGVAADKGDAPTSGARTGEPDDDEASLRLLLEILQPKAVAESFGAMCAAYPTWFAMYAEQTSEEDLARYRAQEAKMLEVLIIAREGPLECALKKDATDEERERLFRFSAALEELQKFGMPPPNLNEVVAQVRPPSGQC